MREPFGTGELLACLRKALRHAARPAAEHATYTAGDLSIDVVKTPTDGLIAVGKLPEVRAAMEKLGVLQTELPHPAYAESHTEERAGYAKLIERAGIKAP